MLGKKKIKIKRTNIYSPSDSGIMFFLALILPQIFMLFLLIICGQSIASNYIVCALVPQLAMAVGFFVISEKKTINYKTANQINFKLNIWIVLIVLAIGVVSLLGFSPLVSWINYLTSKMGYKTVFSNMDISTFPKFFAAIFYAALLPAIVEEFAFRGVITNGLKRYGTTTTIILSGVFFALIHQNLQQFIYQIFLGIVMAYIVVKSGSIIYTIILHFFNNFFVLLSAYLQEGNTRTVDYSVVWNNIYPFLLVLLSIAIVVLLLFLMNYVLKKRDEKRRRMYDLQPEGELIKNNSVNDCKAEHNNTTIDIKGDLANHFYQNPFIVTAFVTGVVFWIITIISSF